MSLRKDMTINERVFHQNINNKPSYVIHHLIYYPFLLLLTNMWDSDYLWEF